MATVGGVALLALISLVVGASPAAASNDTFFSRQWGLEQIGAPRAWTMSRGMGVLIGVVDSGVDAGHPDLAGKIAGNADCAGRPCLDGAGGADPRGHGTSVVGVAVAGTDNGIGVAGVAPDARVLVAKVLGPTGEATVGDVEAGIRWAVNRGARVINVSLGDANFAAGNPLRDAVEFAWSRGAVPVLASGNFGSSSQNYGSLNALVVGANDRNGSVAPYSSPIGTAKWGLVAPGGSGGAGADNNIISTAVGGGYSASAGTSMAAPHVSGTIALLLAQGLSPTAAVNRVLATADRVPCGSGCQGRLNAAAAVGAGPAPVVAAPVVTAPPATAAPATTVKPKPKPVARPAAPVTTKVAAAPPTTTPPVTVPPPPVDVVPVGIVDPAPTEVAAGPGLMELGTDETRSDEANREAALAAVAMVLALSAAAATAGVGSRIRA